MGTFLRHRLHLQIYSDIYWVRGKTVVINVYNKSNNVLGSTEPRRPVMLLRFFCRVRTNNAEERPRVKRRRRHVCRDFGRVCKISFCTLHPSVSLILVLDLNAWGLNKKTKRNKQNKRKAAALPRLCFLFLRWKRRRVIPLKVREGAKGVFSTLIQYRLANTLHQWAQVLCEPSHLHLTFPGDYTLLPKLKHPLRSDTFEKTIRAPAAVVLVTHFKRCFH